MASRRELEALWRAVDENRNRISPWDDHQFFGIIMNLFTASDYRKYRIDQLIELLDDDEVDELYDVLDDLESFKKLHVRY